MAPITEIVRLSDGEAVQALVPGVEPVSLATRQMEALRRERADKRQNQPMQAGGLFDDVARAQQSLF